MQPTYDAIVQYLKRAGHTVLTEHIALKDVETSEGNMSDAQIYAQDTAWLDECDIVVAEVTVPSLGVGYEIGYALHHVKTPVLCLCMEGTSLSAMIQGNVDSALQVVFYNDTAEALNVIDTFLELHHRTQSR